MFPDGLAGGGLLLIRVLCALAMTAALYLLRPLPGWFDAVLLVLAGGILLGLRTRLAAIAGAGLLVFVVFGVGGCPGWAAALLALAFAALAMTGPGAYSIDARLFGRKVITLGSRHDASSDH